MEKDEYRKHFELEENFWWFSGRRAIIKNILKSFHVIEKTQKLLDVGCGTGYNLKFFQSSFSSYGCDISNEALFFSKKRNIKKIAQADAGKLPFKDSSFDLVSMFDVLYHKNVNNDVEVLQEIWRVLKDNGYLLLTDSAFQFLLSRHDLALHARERYTKKILKKRLSGTNFNIEKISYFNFFLFIGVTFVRLIEKIPMMKKKKIESNLKNVNVRLNTALFSIIKLEAALIKHINFPFGSSIVCLAKKT